LEEAQPLLMKHVAATDFIFLDSANLADLNSLLGSVEKSSTHLLLLTREVLTRPWVLVELCYARKAGKRLIPIRVDWPEGATYGREFRFPLDIDSAVKDWKLYQDSRRRNDNLRGQKKPLMDVRRALQGMKSVQRVWSGLSEEDGASQVHFRLVKARVALWECFGQLAATVWRCCASAVKWALAFTHRVLRAACFPCVLLCTALRSPWATTATATSKGRGGEKGQVNMV